MTSVGRTISKSYRKLNTQLHRKAPHYGCSGRLHVAALTKLMAACDSADVLDYGCGKCTLQAGLGVPIHNFDPCIIELSAPPEKADIVACIEVLEHIEPFYLGAVLADLRRLTKKVLYATVATVPSSKEIAPGRNAHLIVRPTEWWIDQLRFHHFKVSDLEEHANGFFATAI